MPKGNFFHSDIIYFIDKYPMFSTEIYDISSERRSISIISVRAGMRLWVNPQVSPCVESKPRS